MTAAFIVSVSIPSEDSIPGIAEQIHEALTDDGIQVLNVNPWARPGMSTEEVSGPSPTEAVQPLF